VLGKVVLCSLGVLLGVLAAEGMLRLYAAVTASGTVVTIDTDLGWKLVPNSRKLVNGEEGTYQIDINSKGLRDREYEPAKPPSVFRIVVVGDSFVFGLGGVEQHEVFTEILEASAPDVEVINMGVMGFSLDQELLYLESAGLKYHPDLVVLALFENDLDESFVAFNDSINRPKGFVGSTADGLQFTPPVVSWFHWLGEYSLIVGKLYRTVLPPRWGTPAPATTTQELKNRMFTDMVLRARADARAADAEFVVIRFPALNAAQPDTLGDILAAMARTHDLQRLDFAADFDEAGPPGAFHLARDGHLNRRGHARVATALHAYLAENTAFGRHVRQQALTQLGP
jgi:lysophospholipase L1-like esterase